MLVFCRRFLVAFALIQFFDIVYNLDSNNGQNLASLVLQSRLASKDPAVAMACFANHMINSQNVSEAYKISYSRCLSAAKSGRESVDDQMSYGRKYIDGMSYDICNRLEYCNNLNATLDVFTCNVNMSSVNTNEVYFLSQNASEFAIQMQEQYRVIEFKHEECCKLADREYVEATALVYQILQDCLDGNSPVTSLYY